MNNTKNVVIAMSGGVDSSISAVLLKDMGYKVTGIFMKNWEEDDNDNNCNVADDYKDAKRVANKLGINLLTVNFSDKYWQLVFQRLIDGLRSGITPNPDIFCNREIKFNYFYQHILSLGYDQLATGHYAKVANEDNKYKLKVANDENKDQTYFLYMLKQDVLKNIIFPLENITKVEVKKIAKEFDLKISEKKEREEQEKLKEEKLRMRESNRKRNDSDYSNGSEEVSNNNEEVAQQLEALDVENSSKN